jgi:peptidoglycan/LPS O-acetylase OafA/YrhL
VGFLLLSHRRVAGAQAICSFVYANNYYQAVFGDPNTGLSHTWSLGIEEQFYLLWPLTFLLLKQTRNRIRFLAIGILTVWTYREALVFLAHVHQGYIYEAFDTRADHLMIGCLLAVLLRAGVCGRLWRGLCFSSRLAWGTLVALAASTACAIHFGSDYRDSVGFIVDPLLVAALIVQTLAHPAAGLGIALNWRWVRYLGTISYSVYLYQQIAIGPAKKLAAHWPALALPVTTAAVILVASGSYWLIERPFLRLKKRYEAGRQAR